MKIIITKIISMSSGSNISSYCISNMSYAYFMQATEYRKVQQKSDGETLLVTIPFAFAQAIQLRKADTVKMTLRDDKSIVVSRATE